MKKRLFSLFLIGSLIFTLIGCKKQTKSIYNAVRDDYANLTSPVYSKDSILYVTFDEEDDSFVETMDVYPNDDLKYLYIKDDISFSISVEDGIVKIYAIQGYGQAPTSKVETFSCDFSEDDCTEDAKFYMSFLKARLLEYGIE